MLGVGDKRRVRYKTHTIITNKYDKNIESLIIRMKEFRESGYLNDYIVRSLEGDKIPVHKLVLSARSRILNELVNENQGELKLKYNTNIVEAFVTHIYSGNAPNLNPVEALQLLHCSLSYGFEFLAEHCSMIAKKAINLKNCVDILITANEIRYPDLIKDCFIFMQQNFTTIAKQSGYLSDLSPELLFKLLSSRTLNGDEDDVFKVFESWRKDNPTATQDVIKELFTAIKMERLSVKSLRSIIKGQCDQQCYDWCTDKALELLSVVTSDAALSRRLSDCLVSVCNFRKSEPFVYDLHSDSWINSQTVDTNCTCAPLLNFDRFSEKQHITFDDEFIFVTGGIGENHEPVKNTWIYRLDTEEWMPGPEMGKARHSHGSIKIGNFLYVVGGYGAKDTAEKFNYNTFGKQEWVRISNLKEPRLLHCCESMVINDTSHLVVVGGCNEAISKTAEALNVDTDEWRSLSPMNVPRVTCMHGVSGHRLFVFSVTDDLSKSGEYYDSKMNQWTFLGNLELVPFSCKMLHLSGCLFGVCRTKDNERLAVVKFDCASFKWNIINKQGPKFPSSFMVHKFSGVKLDTNYIISLSL